MTDQTSGSTFIDVIRTRAREEQKGSRELKRSGVLNAKRLHLSEVELESQEITKEKVKELAVKLKKSTKDREVLLTLKRAFVQGDVEKEIFLKVSGALHGLVGLLTCHDAKLQLEALGCLINLLTADHAIVKSVVRETSPYLITYLHSGGTLLQELSAWALGNIAADCSDCCAVLKSQNFLQALINLLKTSTGDVLHSTLFALKCYMLQVPNDWREIFQQGLGQCLPLLLQSPANENVLLEAANILFFLSTCAEYDDYLVQSGCLEVALHQLTCLVLAAIDNNEVYLTPCNCQLATFLVRSLAGVCAQSEVSVRAILSAANIRLVLRTLLFCNYLHLQKEVLWLLGNITGHANEAVVTSFSRDHQLLKAITGKLFGPVDIVEQSIICTSNLLAQRNEAISAFLSSQITDDILAHVLRTNDPTVASRVILLASLLLKNPDQSRSREKLLGIITDMSCSENEGIRQSALAFLEHDYS